MNRREEKTESGLKTACLIIIAVVVMTAAIYIVVKVFDKISTDYNQIDFTKEQETTTIDIDTENGPVLGWNETEEGWKYYTDKETFITDQWRELEGFLYYFNEDGVMATGEWSQDGQIFTCHDRKGYLKDIQVDLSYVPDSTGENLDSLVRTNAFWCFLKDEESTGPFKTIQYRKTVENKIMTLGAEDKPEKTTKNSMRAYGDYVYFLPKVKDSQLPLLSEEERELCDKLFRMRPGSQQKELIAENVDGYLVLDNTIYYSSQGEILSAVSGVAYVSGEERYSVIIKDESCYLLDQTGKPAVATDSGTLSIGDRVYTIEGDGKITSVAQSNITVDDSEYYLSGGGTRAVVTVKSRLGTRNLIDEPFGVQSFCIVDQSIYYSTVVEKNGAMGFSQIFKTDLDGNNKVAVSERYPGIMEAMFYFKSEGEIYGQYAPSHWEKGYGTAVVISLNGGIYELDDSSVRTGEETQGNDMLELVMARDGKVICLWRDYEWIQNLGRRNILWSKAVELSADKKKLIDKTYMQPEQVADETESTTQEETREIISPIETVSPSAPAETVSPSVPPVISDPVIGTDGPGSKTQAPSPTIPPVTETQPDIEIIPLG